MSSEVRLGWGPEHNVLKIEPEIKNTQVECGKKDSMSYIFKRSETWQDNQNDVSFS